MDEILAKKPADQLENADSQIKIYILMLERKLQNCILWENFNKENETKRLDIQEENFSLKLQIQEFKKHDELQKKLIQEIQTQNGKLDCENKLLKMQATVIQQKLEELKKTNCKPNGIKTPQSNNVDDNNSEANSVLVKGFTERQLNAIPKINIINMGRHMKLKISEKDIIKVSTMERKFYERHSLTPDKIILIVQFRTAEMKVEFLKNKEKLKLQSNLNDIEITDYVSDEVFNLYQYAKILKTHGFTSIYWRNNCVYAKKTRSSFCEPILIKSKTDVDNLKVLQKK
ncbi:uncharacterized protein LOC135957024 [Calliphora vicina]|uniref:uncharacterized protein LOC135957024 n=1 Tax=Calliphora vicina TaxID=7373 RepID=UPI00325BB75C